MPYYTYILQSETTGQLYVGQTNDLDDRVIRHNSNQNKYTKNRGPWCVLFSRQFETRVEAMAFERQLKSWKSAAKVKDWVSRQQSG